MAVRAAVIEISFDLLSEWLHLPPGVQVDAVAPGVDFRSFRVRMSSDNNFLPEVAEGERAPIGTLVITTHQPTVEFKASE